MRSVKSSANAPPASIAVRSASLKLSAITIQTDIAPARKSKDESLRGLLISWINMKGIKPSKTNRYGKKTSPLTGIASSRGNSDEIAKISIGQRCGRSRIVKMPDGLFAVAVSETLPKTLMGALLSIRRDPTQCVAL